MEPIYLKTRNHLGAKPPITNIQTCQYPISNCYKTTISPYPNIPNHHIFIAKYQTKLYRNVWKYLDIRDKLFDIVMLFILGGFGVSS
jgi:hypothetical protein